MSSKIPDETELKELPQVDYSILPPDIEEAIIKKRYEVTEKSKLTWDGKQFLVRIPKEITQEMGITKENQIVFKLKKPLPDSNEKSSLEILLV